MSSEHFACVIPARLGSKRLKKKNIKLLDGYPMIYYSIKAARDSNLFDKIYVATESQEIADIAIKYGANVPFLIPEKLCHDDQPSHLPCQYLLEHLTVDMEYDVLLCLQPTSALRNSEDIIEGIKYFQKNDCDFVVSTTLIDPHYFHWAIEKTGENNECQMHFGSKYLRERIYLPKFYRPNGSIKIARLSKLKKHGHFFGEKLGMIFTPEERSIHISTQYEFNIASSCLVANN